MVKVVVPMPLPLPQAVPVVPAGRAQAAMAAPAVTAALRLRLPLLLAVAGAAGATEVPEGVLPPMAVQEAQVPAGRAAISASSMKAPSPRQVVRSLQGFLPKALAEPGSVEARAEAALRQVATGPLAAQVVREVLPLPLLAPKAVPAVPEATAPPAVMVVTEVMPLLFQAPQVVMEPTGPLAGLGGAPAPMAVQEATVTAARPAISP